MSSYINFAVAQAHQQDLLRAAEKSRVVAMAPHRRFSLFGGIRRSVPRERRTRQVATAPTVAAARGA
jgi:hypothetical protein